MKALVIYFSRADENYFGGSMRYISKGNTEVIAEYIQEIVTEQLASYIGYVEQITM